ncbi:MAG: LptF/LptG family permease, partial [Phycisphaerae bacterium]|nr:LptF/LptG family permease [Phycisphaerae bacterium]
MSELTKMLVITTGIMVTVIAFGAAAKPLAENQIGADTIAKYVSLAIVPMMQFALPFAAGFAGTLVMHRFVTDNEVTAMSAVGMSYGRILMPVAILGLVLAAIMFGLVAFVVPHFWERMKELGTADATQLLVAAVNRGEALQAGDMLIYADTVTTVPSPADTGAQRRLILGGVAAIELNKGPFAAPATEFTAESAAVDVHVTESGTVAKMVLVNATIFRPGDGAIASVPRVEPEAAALDRNFYRGPKFLPLHELIELRDDVDRALVVREVALPLAAVVGEYDVWQCVVQQAAAGGPIALRQQSSAREYRIEHARLVAGDAVPAHPGTLVRVTELIDGRAVRTTEADRVALRVVSEVGFEPSMVLTVSAPQRTRNVVDGVSARWPPRVDDLMPVECDRRDWSAARSQELLQRVSAIPAKDAEAPYRDMARRAASFASVLEKRRADVRFESDSHIMQRIAQSVSVALVLLLGAVLAVWMRRALPLMVYVLAFL